jgi:glycerol uptake facilitator-like aquaporin
MLNNYLIEYIGTLLICTTILFTHANPILVGLAYTTALYIGEGITRGHFSPLTLVIQYALKRIKLSDALKLLAVQVAAALSVTVLYNPFIHS